MIGLCSGIDCRSACGPCHLHRNGDILTARVSNIEVNPNVGAGLIIRWFSEYIAIIKIAQAPLRIDKDAHVIRACGLRHHRHQRVCRLNSFAHGGLRNQQGRQNGGHHGSSSHNRNDGPFQNCRHRRACGDPCTTLRLVVYQHHRAGSYVIGADFNHHFVQAGLGLAVLIDLAIKLELGGIPQ